MSDNVNPGDIIRIDYPDGSAVEGAHVGQYAYLHIVHVGGLDHYARPGAITVLRQATHAPAPLTVGTWVRCKEYPDWISVVTEIVDDTFVKVRDWDSVLSGEVDGCILTAIDGPPEPPDGSVYLIGTAVYERHGTGHYQTGRSGVHSWNGIVDSADDTDLAALRILGNTGRAAS